MYIYTHKCSNPKFYFCFLMGRKKTCEVQQTSEGKKF